MLSISRSITFILLNFIGLKLTKSNPNITSLVDNDFKQFSCSVFLRTQNSQVHCFVSFIYSIEYTKISDCFQNNNNVQISVGMEIFDPDFTLSNRSFVCTSNVHLSLKVLFSDGDPKTQYMEMRPEKLPTNLFNEIPADEYKLHFLFPKSPEFIHDRGEVVKYSIFDIEDPTLELNIFIEFYPKSDFISLPPICHAYNLHGNSPISVTEEEIVFIPCINLNETADDLALPPRLFTEDKELHVDNVRIFYDKWKGFIFNATNFEGTIQGNYTCTVAGCTNHTFVLVNAETRPLSNELHLHGPKFNLMLGKKEKPSNSGVLLFCSEVNKTIDVQLESSSFPPNASVHEIAKYSAYSIGYETPRNIITALVPYLNETERKEYSGWVKDDEDDSDTLFFVCVKDDVPKIFWTVKYDSVNVPFYYSREHNAFICEETPLEMFGVESFILLYHWECKNILQCEIVMSHCIKEEEQIMEGRSDIKTLSYSKENLCLKSLQTNLVPCSDVGKINAPTKLCKAIRPGKKGIVQCNTRVSSHLNFRMQYLYFEGFDGKVYVDEELKDKPPLYATLRLTNFNKEDHFWTGDYFNFRCEAHSFLYADGIRWFFKYENGTVLHPPTDLIIFLQRENQDKYNPESNVQFYFDDITLVEVICSAPLLRTYGWDNISITFNVFDQVAPKINSETTFYLKENITDQLLPCQTVGIPVPDIVWIKSGKEIENPLAILDEHILVFPHYDLIFLGEYTCTAESIAGKASTIFTVHKAVDLEGDNKHKLYYTLAGLATLIVIIIAVIILIFFRIQKEKKRKEMKEIILLVEGVESGESNVDNIDENTDPLQQPFKKSFSIQKEDFTINWHRPLGSGEFGEVFQGTLNAIEGPIAIKMLKKNAKIDHLRALASELKILMFIGDHENLVTLLGAYKDELEKGILYVAVEFCGLGSLESYLRMNKHVFMKCPQLRCLNGDSDSTEININMNPYFTFHSFATLLKWCKQITCGMEYLGLKYVVHSDLATRNVLLTSEGNAKVTDFGLSRRMYNYTEYVKTSDDPLPWQWIAPESILLQKYSSKSDVWAYGVTMWEIFTFGERPYPTFSFNEEFLEMIRSGMRCKKPKHAPNAIHVLMNKCWEYDPERRPSFSSLKCSLTELIDNPCELEVKVPNHPSDSKNLQHGGGYISQNMKSHPDLHSIPEGYTKLADIMSIGS